jgi:hypothetical protein
MRSIKTKLFTNTRPVLAVKCVSHDRAPNRSTLTTELQFGNDSATGIHFANLRYDRAPKWIDTRDRASKCIDDMTSLQSTGLQRDRAPNRSTLATELQNALTIRQVFNRQVYNVTELQIDGLMRET